MLIALALNENHDLLDRYRANRKCNTHRQEYHDRQSPR